MTGELNTALLTVAGITVGATSGLIIGGFIGAITPIANENRYMPKTVGAMKLVNGVFYGSAGLTMGVLVGGVSVHYIPSAIQSSALSSIKGLLIYGTAGFFTYKISKNFLHNVAEINSSSLFAALFATGTVGLISQVR